MKPFALFTVIVIAICGCTEAIRAPVANPTETRTSSPVDADNTAVNQRDADSGVKTPIDQNENQTDIDITANIRKRVVDTEMSVNAQNVKIITQGGQVMLRGPVKSDEERKKIEGIAHDVAGPGKVTNQLEVEKSP